MNRLTNGNANAPPNIMDKSKDWQLELLMEKLRSKATQFKSFVETSKNVRMTLLDKRYALDSVEKSQHQKCLDTLQHSIKVTSLQSMVERLESLTRQLGLKFVQGTSGVELFISSDMFYLEIMLDQTGLVLDVKVHHEGKNEQSCEELVSCLMKGDFDDFTAQLEGFASIYQLNAEKKVKCKAYTALQSLETDLITLAQLQNFMKEPFNVLYKSPVGILEKRKGGHAMKLTYFVSPYDLINKEKCDLEPINLEVITNKNLGYGVTIYMEGSTAHKLQTTPLITVNRNHNGKGTPSYAVLTSTNSAVIPAYFVLRLNKPMPICVSLVRQIQVITELDCGDLSSPHPLLSLIATHCSDGKLDSGNNKGLFVTLPDQNHCYFMTENKKMQGILVHNIPFTHPAHVAQILVILRQQALFNTIIGSCIRPNSKQDFENMIMLEISALSSTHISISLEHPLEESMATAEIDLSDISNLICRVHSPGTPPPLNAPDLATELTTKVLNRCFSVPVTMRAVLKFWDKLIVRKNHFGGQHENFNLPLGSGDPGGKNANSGNNTNNSANLTEAPILKDSVGVTPLMPHQGMFLNESIMSSANFTNFQSNASSDGNATTVLTNIELTNILSGGCDKVVKRSTKRKASDEIWKGKIKKPGVDQDESSCDSTSNDLNQERVNSGLGFHSDLELSGLDASELINDKEVADFDPDDLGDVEDILAGNQKEKAVEFEPKSVSSLIPPCVSITPVLQTPGFGVNPSLARTGIEIIPINAATTTLPNSITITPIQSVQIISKNDERSKEKKNISSNLIKQRTDDKRLDKKKKRKRVDEPTMGPPERPIKDNLTKPITANPININPESIPLPTLASINNNSPNMLKFNASPTHQQRPNSANSNPKSKHHSPKNSPAHIQSPKHTITGISSPKHHGTSPKHPSTSGSGKPSMSTLKSAANSPSSNKSGEKIKSKESSSREKDKKGGLINPTKNKAIKVKPLDLNCMELPLQDGLLSPNSCLDLSKNPNQLQRNRKGSLSAIVDKLKSAQCDILPTDLTSKSGKPQATKNSDTNKLNKLGDKLNSEYMVKPSSEGIKLTINKTRTKEGGNKASGLKNVGSPKTHTGLKPGVNSGPASKKPQTLPQKNTLNSASSTYPFKSSNQKLTGGVKSSSSSIGSNLMKAKLSPKLGSTSATDLSNRGSNKDRPKLNKSNSDKSIFTNRDAKKGSPTQWDGENERTYKPLSKLDHFSTPSTLMDNNMKFDKTFQIPKLSARSAAEDKKLAQPKIAFDLLTNKTDLSVKYPMALPTSKIFDGNMEAKIRNSLNSNTLVQSSSSPKKDPLLLNDVDAEKLIKVDDFKSNYNPISASKHFPPASNEPLSLSTKSIDLTAKFIAPAAPKDDKKLDNKKLLLVDDGLLDFSQKGDKITPSVSVHIVKSPAPSPLIMLNASPVITDDELMDEALVGLGK